MIKIGKCWAHIQPHLLEHRLPLEQGLSISAGLTVWSTQSSDAGYYPGHGRVINSIPELYFLEASTPPTSLFPSPLMTSRFLQALHQMSPRGQYGPSLRIAALEPDASGTSSIIITWDFVRNSDLFPGPTAIGSAF